MASIQKPKGEFRQYIFWEGLWRHVYIVSTHFQQTIFNESEKMVDFKLSKKTRMVHTAPRNMFQDNKPRKTKAQQ